MLKIRDLCYSYKNHKALDNINIEVKESSLTFLIGENGAGKSTLMKCILGLLNYTLGSITIDGVDLRKISNKKRARLIAYVPQATLSLFNHSVIDIVMMSKVGEYSFYESPNIEDEKKALEVLKLLGIDRFAERGYMSLSGGEQQLVLIARALYQDSKIILMDEPSSGLDFGNRIHLLDVCDKLKNNGITILMSSHQPQDAIDYADYAILLSHGRVLDYGKTTEVINKKSLYDLYNIDIDIIDINNRKVCLRRKMYED